MPQCRSVISSQALYILLIVGVVASSVASEISNSCDSDLAPRQQPITTIDSQWVPTIATSSMTLNSSMATNNDSVTYLLDSSVATLILDGELWVREPYTLLGHRKELWLQLEQTKISLDQLEVRSTTLKRSLAAYRFMEQRQASGARPLLITPTVGLELSRSKKVRIILSACKIIVIMIKN